MDQDNKEKQKDQFYIINNEERRLIELAKKIESENSPYFYGSSSV